MNPRFGLDQADPLQPPADAGRQTSQPLAGGVLRGRARKSTAAQILDVRPNGVRLPSAKLAKREYRYSYKPASSVLPGRQMDGPNPLGIKSQFKGLDEIWNSCIDDLRKLSMRLRDGQGEMTPAVWEELPAEIRSDVDHPLTDAICKLVVECTDDENRILIPVSKLVEVFKLGPAAAARKKQTPGDSQMICRHVGFVGYRLEPDAYFTGNAYRTDERVAAFLKVSDEATDHTRYNAAACMLQLGLVIASADGNVQPEELATISQEIERTFQLNAQEQRRLAALRGLLLAEGADTKRLNQMLAALTPEIRHGIAKLLLAIVAADGVVTKEEIRAVRKCYSTLGFEKAEMDRAIDALRVGSTDEPVTVQAGVPGPVGEAIPPPPGEAGFTLNRDTIAAIMKDTEEVARILAAAMTADQQPAPAAIAAAEPAPAPTAAPAGNVAGADAVTTIAITAPAPVPGNVLIPTDTLSKALAETPVGRAIPSNS
ncbi:MAG: TerB family tellurite resistance protein [Phycisphaerae bacterium]|nr:TerB family tellurite resistance protein [Phycisphaerae bacterium]